MVINYKWFLLHFEYIQLFPLSDRVSFAIDGFYEMDQKVGNNIVLTAATDCERDPCTTKSVPLVYSSLVILSK